MKVGIITLNGYFNYGNRLQNYALQKSLEKLGVNVTTIWHTNFKELLKTKFKVTIPINNKLKKQRNLYLFSKKYIKTSFVFNIKKLSNKYNYFICGSDQVWNYNFNTFNDDMFLKFSPQSKNIAYAASFGISSISDEYKQKYKDGLNNFKAISVREDDAKKIINEIDHKISCEVVIDPTLLLETNEWDEIANNSKVFTPKKYIFVYMLGKLSKNERDKISKISKENECEIINIMDEKSKYYSCGVEDFLYLIKNAFLVCTDSFHSTVFSIIFKTKFLVFERNDKYEKMNSRLNTLLNKVNMEEQYITCNSNNLHFENLNFDNAHEIIKKERKIAKEYLRKVII